MVHPRMKSRLDSTGKSSGMDALRRSGLGWRRTEPGDLDHISAIEQRAYAFPWNLGIFQDCLRAGYICLSATWHGEIIGYGVMSVAVGECHILNICIAPEWQGLGLGRGLLRRMLRIARQQGADTAFLEVRPSNLAARRLYEASGFNEVGVRRGYYPAVRGREDAIILARALLL